MYYTIRLGINRVHLILFYIHNEAKQAEMQGRNFYIISSKLKILRDSVVNTKI